jgi:2-haloacid dehalogenase
MVAQVTGTKLAELCMIASHPWDLIGARAAGCSAALIKRPGVAPFVAPGLKEPEIVALNLTEIATQLVQLKHA